MSIGQRSCRQTVQPTSPRNRGKLWGPDPKEAVRRSLLELQPPRQGARADIGTGAVWLVLRGSKVTYCAGGGVQQLVRKHPHETHRLPLLG